MTQNSKEIYNTIIAREQILNAMDDNLKLQEKNISMLTDKKIHSLRIADVFKLAISHIERTPQLFRGLCPLVRSISNIHIDTGASAYLRSQKPTGYRNRQFYKHHLYTGDKLYWWSCIEHPVDETQFTDAEIEELMKEKVRFLKHLIHKLTK